MKSVVTPRLVRSIALLAGSALAVGFVAAAAQAPTPKSELRSADSFAEMADQNARSLALFGEAMKVIGSPRCMNCHPATRVPTQGDNLHPHVPLMNATASGHGPDGLTCRACHGDENVSTFGRSVASIPGNAHWGLAPASMAWQGLTPSGVCAQLKDTARNGSRSLAMIHEHMQNDPLVGWAWNPGQGRSPAPGTQAVFGELIGAWIDSGASCPAE